MLSHLVVIILAMGLVALTLLSFLENYFLQSTEDSLVAQARFTVQTIIPNALTAGPPVDDASAAEQRDSTTSGQSQPANRRRSRRQPACSTRMDLSSLANTSLQLGTQLDTRIRLLNRRAACSSIRRKSDSEIRICKAIRSSRAPCKGNMPAGSIRPATRRRSPSPCRS